MGAPAMGGSPLDGQTPRRPCGSSGRAPAGRRGGGEVRGKTSPEVASVEVIAVSRLPREGGSVPGRRG